MEVSDRAAKKEAGRWRWGGDQLEKWWGEGQEEEWSGDGMKKGW